ncbi:hypothetical protein [Thermaurantimonas aggregans]|uniref:hypothetical protein n=1 Tax=Thermaurantimonas aggregans TaxID=2173829 RepID=UPI0023F3847A|nr:hypothetical protein [Thermaurantimonas aggregans]MCX8147854.1 hypothetical protein [Thermaurantimonas aggregans]
MKIKAFTRIALTVAHLTAFGQNENLGQIKLEVIGSYKATIEDAQKLNDLPRTEDTARSRVPVKFEIKPIVLATDYTPEPLKPARISKSAIEPVPRTFVRIGAGLYATPLAEVRYDSDRSRNNAFGAGFNHYSTRTGVRNIVFENNGLSTTSGSVYYRHFFTNYSLGASTDLEYDRVKYYGLPKLALPPVDTFRAGDPAIQSYLISTTRVDATRLVPVSQFAMTNLGFRFDFLRDRYDIAELHAALPIDFRLKRTDNRNLNLRLAYEHMQHYNTQNDLAMAFSANVIRVRPAMNFSKDEWQFDLGLNMVLSNYVRKNLISIDPKEPDEMYFFIFPEGRFKLPVITDVLEFDGMLSFDYQLNTLRTLSRQWLFISPGIELDYTQKVQAQVGMSGLIFPGASYHLSAGYIDWRNLPIFYRSPFYYTTPQDIQGVEVLYLDGNQVPLQAKLAIKLTKNIDAEGIVNYNHYEMKGGKAWHLPNWRNEIKLKYSNGNSFDLGFDVFFIGERTAFDQSLNTAISARLRPYTDANMHLNYHFSKQMSFFLTINNMFFNAYEHYLGYPAQQFLAIVGAVYKL